jgi:hypothetical protein
VPARNSVKLLTRTQNESHGGPRSPCACCNNWEICGPVNPADREACALRGPRSASVLKASFVAGAQDNAKFPSAADPSAGTVNFLLSRCATAAAARSAWICRPRSILFPIYAASPQRTACNIASVCYMQRAGIATSAKHHPTALFRLARRVRGPRTNSGSRPPPRAWAALVPGGGAAAGSHVPCEPVMRPGKERGAASGSPMHSRARSANPARPAIGQATEGVAEQNPQASRAQPRQSARFSPHASSSPAWRNETFARYTWLPSSLRRWNIVSCVARRDAGETASGPACLGPCVPVYGTTKRDIGETALAAGCVIIVVRPTERRAPRDIGQRRRRLGAAATCGTSSPR